MNSAHLEKQFIDQVMAHQGIIHRICGMYCADEEDRKDLFQDILVNLWKSYSSFRGDAEFSTWMYRVSLNIAFQKLRATARNREQATPPGRFDEMENPGKEGLPEQERQQLYSAIEQLNEIEKSVVMLYLEEKGNDEIAAILGITQNHVRVKMTRIRKKLRKTVEVRCHGA